MTEHMTMLDPLKETETVEELKKMLRDSYMECIVEIGDDGAKARCEHDVLGPLEVKKLLYIALCDGGREEKIGNVKIMYKKLKKGEAIVMWETGTRCRVYISGECIPCGNCPYSKTSCLE